MKRPLLLAAASFAAIPAGAACSLDAVYADASAKATPRLNATDYAAAVAAMAADAKNACPSLPWDTIMYVAETIMREDLAVRLGTTPQYKLGVLARLHQSAAKAAQGACKGEGINLRFCLETQACAESGGNSCLCMPPAKRSQRPICG